MGPRYACPVRLYDVAILGKVSSTNVQIHLPPSKGWPKDSLKKLAKLSANMKYNVFRRFLTEEVRRNDHPTKAYLTLAGLFASIFNFPMHAILRFPRP
jgi:hypothetical protein